MCDVWSFINSVTVGGALFAGCPPATVIVTVNDDAGGVVGEQRGTNKRRGEWTPIWLRFDRSLEG